MPYDVALTALADPTRRRIFEELRHAPQRVAAITRHVPVSQPAVSQHLKVLKKAGLVDQRPEGAHQVYFIDLKGLGALRAWLDQFWDSQLDAFRAAAETSSTSKKEDIKHG